MSTSDMSYLSWWLSKISKLLHEMTTAPTHVQQLVPHVPSYVGFCNAFSCATGRVGLSHTKAMHSLVWRFEWPSDITGQICSSQNPSGYLTINDLECASLLLYFLIHEQLVDLTLEHVAAWCNNCSMVSWTSHATSHSLVIVQ